MSDEPIEDISVDDVDDMSASDLEKVTTEQDTTAQQPEYWVDYQLDHHGIIYCWRNNRKQILLGIEESIAPHTDAYDIVLLTAEAEFIVSVGEFDTETDALRQALLIQKQYPEGEIPEVNDWQDAQENPPQTETEAFEEASEESGLLGNLKNVLYRK